MIIYFKINPFSLTFFHRLDHYGSEPHPSPSQGRQALQDQHAQEGWVGAQFQHLQAEARQGMVADGREGRGGTPACGE